MRGRRGTWRHPLPFHVAGVALGDINRRFAWQAYYLWDWAGSGDALGSPVTPCGAAAFLRGAWRHPLPFHVAGVALGGIHRRFAWRHPPPFHAAGVALGDIYRRFAWQDWPGVSFGFNGAVFLLQVCASVSQHGFIVLFQV